METRESFIESVRSAASSDGQSGVETLLRERLSVWDGPPEWLGTPSEGGVEILHADADLTIMIVIWPSRLVTEPHNHNIWATIGIYQGREDNILWQRDGETIVADRAHSVGAGEVLSLAEDAIHSVVNPLPGLTGAIHVYGGDFMGTSKSEWDIEFHRERPRNIEKIRRAFVTSD